MSDSGKGSVNCQVCSKEMNESEPFDEVSIGIKRCQNRGLGVSPR